MTANVEAGSHTSSQEATAPTLTPQASKAPKDKECPFCKTPYTASSLGRHLDSYIRETNPKPDDGIHVVEEIRKLREGITRRHMLPKSKSAKRSSNVRSKEALLEDGDEVMHNGSDSDESQDNASPAIPLKKPGAAAVRSKAAAANRQTSGSRDVSRRRTLKADFHARQGQANDDNDMMAAEYALKEVLGCVKEASARIAQAGLFDFDPFELTFPALCLKILPPPPTLKAPLPFPTKESWSLSPPGPQQWEALQVAINDKILSGQRVLSAAHASASSPLLTPPPMDFDVNRLTNHLNDAYAQWYSLSPQYKVDMWQLETLRMFSAADVAQRSMRQRLDTMMQENEDLRKELAHLRREAETGSADGHYVPVTPTLTLPRKTVEELCNNEFDAHQWDFDILLRKWRTTMREQRLGTKGMSGQRRLSSAPVPRTDTVPVQVEEDTAKTNAQKTPTALSRKSTASRARPSRARKPASPQLGNDQTGGTGVVDVDLKNSSRRPSLVPGRSATPVPASPPPQVDASLLSVSAQPTQRHNSSQPSPSMISSQQQDRRGSGQYQHHVSPQVSPEESRRNSMQYAQTLLSQTPHHHQIQMQASLSQQPQSQLMQQYAEPPMMQVTMATGGGGGGGDNSVALQPSYPVQPSSVPDWVSQHQAPQQPQQHHPLSGVPMPLPPATSQPQQQPIDYPPFPTSLGLQVPQTHDARRHSHPLLDHTAHHAEMQGVQVPYQHQQAGMESMGMQVDFVGQSGIGIGSRVG